MKKLSNIGLLAMLLCYVLLAFAFGTRQESKLALILPASILFPGGYFFWRWQKRIENEKDEVVLNTWIEQLVSANDSLIERTREARQQERCECPACGSSLQRAVTPPVILPDQHVYMCRDCNTVWAEPKPLWPMIAMILAGFIPPLIALLIAILDWGINYEAAAYFLSVPLIAIFLFKGFSGFRNRRSRARLILREVKK